MTERKAVTRKAVAIALVATCALEIATVVGLRAATAVQRGILLTSDVVQLVVAVVVIIGQASGIWIVVARNEAARPAPRAVLCLIVAVVLFAGAYASGRSDEMFTVTDAIFTFAFNLAAMSAAILLATGVVRTYWSLAKRSRISP